MFYIAKPRKTKSMLLIQKFFNLVITYIYLKTLFVYQFINIKKYFSSFFKSKKVFSKSFNNFLEITSNITYYLNNILKTWQFAYLFFF